MIRFSQEEGMIKPDGITKLDGTHDIKYKLPHIAIGVFSEFLLADIVQKFSCEKVGANEGSVNNFVQSDFRVFKELFDYDFSPLIMNILFHIQTLLLGIYLHQNKLLYLYKSFLDFLLNLVLLLHLVLMIYVFVFFLHFLLIIHMHTYKILAILVNLLLILYFHMSLLLEYLLLAVKSFLTIFYSHLKKYIFLPNHHNYTKLQLKLHILYPIICIYIFS